MKRSLVAIVVIVVVAVIVGVIIAGRGSSGSSDNSMNMNTPSSSSSQNPTATSQVTIQGFAFTPADITVKTGATVTWTNQDTTGHTVMETDGQDGPNSPQLSKGQSYSFTFKKAGTYHYHCSIHPDMVGTVTVTD